MGVQNSTNAVPSLLAIYIYILQNVQYSTVLTSDKDGRCHPSSNLHCQQPVCMRRYISNHTHTRVKMTGASQRTVGAKKTPFGSYFCFS